MSRAHGVTVHMLNTEKLAELFRNAGDDADRETRKGITGDYFMETGIMVNPECYIRTINYEGVSDRGMVNDVFNDQFAVYTNYGYIEFTESQLRECLTETTIDLADFIRVFGDRLERNFSINYNWAIGSVKGR